jgi:uncharacterized protein (TIGR00369 family)
MSDDITVENVQALITRGPYHQWLGLKVIAVHDDGIELKATWREEWVVNPDRRYTHGGVLAALVDLAADWAMVKRTGRGVPTIDLRVDYHAAAMPGDLIAKGKVVRAGGQFSTAEAQVFDESGKLLASGRGTYFTAPPKA